jgi:hypothetical protein
MLRFPSPYGDYLTAKSHCESRPRAHARQQNAGVRRAPTIDAAASAEETSAPASIGEAATAAIAVGATSVEPTCPPSGPVRPPPPPRSRGPGIAAPPPPPAPAMTSGVLPGATTKLPPPPPPPVKPWLPDMPAPPTAICKASPAVKSKSPPISAPRPPAPEPPMEGEGGTPFPPCSPQALYAPATREEACALWQAHAKWR